MSDRASTEASHFPTQLRPRCVGHPPLALPLSVIPLIVMLSAAKLLRTGAPLKPAFGLSGNARISPFFLLTFQNPHNRNNRVPIPGRRRAPEQLIQLTQIADGFHVPAIHS